MFAYFVEILTPTRDLFEIDYQTGYFGLRI